MGRPPVLHVRLCCTIMLHYRQRRNPGLRPQDVDTGFIAKYGDELKAPPPSKKVGRGRGRGLGRAGVGGRALALSQVPAGRRFEQRQPCCCRLAAAAFAAAAGAGAAAIWACGAVSKGGGSLEYSATPRPPAEQPGGGGGQEAGSSSQEGQGDGLRPAVHKNWSGRALLMRALPR